MQCIKHTGLWIVICLLALQCPARSELSFRDHISPRNAERLGRKSTKYIILHTTEGPGKGSLSKVHDNGEAHYVVDTGGRIYRIIDRHRIAYHAGRSMWNNSRNLDEMSVGIEIVGYHNKSLTTSQYEAVRGLLDQIQKVYSIPDQHVLPHSMVAYGSPNRWHKRSHRGRKRCGMLLASPAVRRKLGLYAQPTFDPDVKAGRLAIGDAYLYGILFDNAVAQAQEPTPPQSESTDEMTIGNGRSAWDVARDQYNRATTQYIFPDGTIKHGHEITNWKRIPPGTRVVLDKSASDNVEETIKELGVDGATAYEIAGDEHASEGTIYFLSDGRVRTGHELGESAIDRLPKNTRMLVGYVVGGYITRTRSAYDVCGELWKAPSTIYRFPDGKIHYGSDVDEGSIPRGTQVFFRN